MTKTDPKTFKAEKLAKLFRQMIWIMSVEHPECKTCKEATKWAGEQLEALQAIK